MANNDDIQQDTIMVTQEGLEQMKQELDERLQKREEIAAEIDEARSLGDLRENDPYKMAMQNKELNDTRIDELEYMINMAQVVEKDGDGIIGIGDKVEIENTKSNRAKTITLVGRQASQESDPREGKISIDSPIGSAIMGKKQGDKVTVQLPNGEVEYKIKKVS